MKFLFLDTETTGSDPEDRLIQLAWYCDRTEFNEGLFKAPLPIKYGAMGVHHITNEEVDAMPPFKETTMFGNLQILLDSGYIIVAHNAKFDVDMLRREGFTINRYVDTLKLARQYVKDTDSYALQALRYKLNLEPTLITKEEMTAHDAKGDVALLYELFNYLRERIKLYTKLNSFLNDEEADEVLIKSCEPSLIDVVSFGKYKGQKWEDVARLHRDYLSWLWDQPGEKDPDLLFTLKHYLKR